MWHTAKRTEKNISGILAKTMPPNKNMQDGIIESENAFNLSFLFQHIAQNIKYVKHKPPITDKYTISA